MVRAFTNGTRPERVNHNANEYYANGEADRYTGASNNIQKDLTYKALELLGVKKGEFHFIADIGCGSGLSSRILSLEGHSWVGTDISLDMLSLAQNMDKGKNTDADGNKASTSKEPPPAPTNVSLCKGRLIASDMSQGLPFRTNSFDIAISVSAVQWLCYNKTPREAAERFFKSVWRCSSSKNSFSSNSSTGPSPRAAFQVYLENDEHMNILLEAARTAGFLATYCMDYPHKTPAKKFYIMLSKEEDQKNEREVEKTATAAVAETAHVVKSFSRCCNLAWPATACCSLPWITWREGNNPHAARISAPRVVQEHANVGKRILRLLRHASSNGGTLSPPTLRATTDDTSTYQQSLLSMEIAVPHVGFMPCGGPCMLQIQLQTEVLDYYATRQGGSSSRKRKEREEDEEDGENDGSSKIEEAKDARNTIISDTSNLIPGVANLLWQFLGCSDDELLEAKCTSNNPKIKNKTENQQKESSSFLSWSEHFQKARSTAEKKKEAETTTPATAPSSESDTKKAFFYLEHVNEEAEDTSIAILHATKPPVPEILVLTSDSNNSGVEDVRKKLISLCAERNASVIGVDILVHSINNVSCAWLMYVPGLQTTPRAEIFQQWCRWRC